MTSKSNYSGDDNDNSYGKMDPAFAGMTMVWFTSVGMPARHGPGSRLSPG